MVSGRLAYNLQTSQAATTDANGNAEIILGPTKVRERWEVTGIATELFPQNTDYSPVVEIRRNGFELIAGSYNANLDSATGSVIELRNNEYLKCTLTGAEPGVRWQMTVNGQGYAI